MIETMIREDEVAVTGSPEWASGGPTAHWLPLDGRPF